ncbi:tautomerase family protein [Mucilaginibacter antarcticus]|uniref:tautomerase family protein n=1 Tax=Mucilaginibacter antarcticus TaxID=1855725 RepID=UPI0036400E17
MPFVRISLLKTVSKNDRKKISAAIHHALMAEFDIPQFDYFHVIDALEPDDLFFQKLSGNRPCSGYGLYPDNCRLRKEL